MMDLDSKYKVRDYTSSEKQPHKIFTSVANMGTNVQNKISLQGRMKTNVGLQPRIYTNVRINNTAFLRHLFWHYKRSA